ncbi:MAG: pyrroline-5-carboxylate reductase [Dethiobacteria bacterium]
MNVNVGLIGCGMMGSVLAKGIIKAEVLKPQQVIVYDSQAEKAEKLGEEEKVAVAADVEEVCQKADYILIAVKPQDLSSLLQTIAPLLEQEQVIVSIAAGVTTAYFEEKLKKEIAVVRVMPNTPFLVKEGMAAICGGDHATEKELQIVQEMLSPLAKVVVVKEELMDAVTGLSGSGPAYVYLFIEALADGGVEAGLPRDMANLLAAQTVFGAAKMVLEMDKSPAELKNMVTSPGGTTSAGLLALEENGVRASLIKAVNKAAERARKLSK